MCSCLHDIGNNKTPNAETTKTKRFFKYDKQSRTPNIPLLHTSYIFKGMKPKHKIYRLFNGNTCRLNYKPFFSLFFLLLLSLFHFIFSSITSAYKIQYISLFNVQPLLFFIFFFCFAIFAPISCCCYCYCLFLQILLSVIAAVIHTHTDLFLSFFSFNFY